MSNLDSHIRKECHQQHYCTCWLCLYSVGFFITGSCIGSDGKRFSDGSEWSPLPCSKCVCRDGLVTCYPVLCDVTVCPAVGFHWSPFYWLCERKSRIREN